jgi:hypothetical protein
VVDEHVARFWSRVAVRGRHKCWLWRGPTDDDGYGLTRFRGPNRRATHVALELDGRPLLPGEVARHTCDTPRCVNPLHLVAGTQRDNAQDKLDRGRGHRQRLMLADALEIRRRAGLGERPADLAREYGVSPAHISNIIAGRTWISG